MHSIYVSGLNAYLCLIAVEILHHHKSFKIANTDINNSASKINYFLLTKFDFTTTLYPIVALKKASTKSMIFSFLWNELNLLDIKYSLRKYETFFRHMKKRILFHFLR